MTSRTMTGAWQGIGEGLSILGHQSMQDNSEKARMELMQSLNLQRDELEAGRRSAETAADREYRSGEAAADREFRGEQAKTLAELEREKWGRDDDRTDAAGKYKVQAANIKANGKDKDKSGEVKTSVTADGFTTITYYDGTVDRTDLNTGITSRMAKPGGQPSAIPDSILQEAQAAAEIEMENKSSGLFSWFKDDKDTFSDHGGSREKAKSAFVAQTLSDRGYGPELIKQYTGVSPKGAAQGPSDEQLQSVVSKIDPGERDAFLAEAAQRYDKPTVDRLAAMLPAPAGKPATNILGQESAPVPQQAKPEAKPEPAAEPPKNKVEAAFDEQGAYPKPIQWGIDTFKSMSAGNDRAKAERLKFMEENGGMTKHEVKTAVANFYSSINEGGRPSKDVVSKLLSIVDTLDAKKKADVIAAAKRYKLIKEDAE